MTEQEAGPERMLSIVDRRDADRVVLSISGELDMGSAPRLASAISAFVADDSIRRIILELSGTEFVDSSGLRAIMAAHRELESSGRELRLRTPSAPVIRLLDITSLTDHFVIDA